jgi:hypothetical protein
MSIGRNESVDSPSHLLTQYSEIKLLPSDLLKRGYGNEASECTIYVRRGGDMFQYLRGLAHNMVYNN